MSLNSSQYTQTTTCKIFIRPLGATAFIDVGRSTEPKIVEDIKTVDVDEPANGLNLTVDERVVGLKSAYEAMISEWTPENLQIVHLADPATQVIRNAATALTVPITGVQFRRAYFMNGQNVTNVSVTEGAITRVEGVDYRLEAGSGYIIIIPGGAISEGVNLLVTYDRPADVRSQYIRFSQTRHEGDIRIEYYDGFSDEPLHVHTFRGSYRAIEQSGGTNSALETFKLRMLALDRVTINSRKIQ